ncbi:MAG: PrpF domain-containing protein [Nocardioides sp.]|uniref:PrpF domain-containing protein n=1 Tax=Nocardioides sp. TaxID=35761 RepID=UPI0039E3DCC8
MTGPGVRGALMRGGTSKGGVFLASDLPADPAERDALMLRIMGSPDPRQIDGLGGAHPLTSKVAVVSASELDGVDVDYLFLQVVVDRAVVSTGQTCGNMLAAVGPFAVDRGLVPAVDPVTEVSVRLVNTGTTALLRVQTPGGVVTYDGDTTLTGVPGTAAPVEVVSTPSEKPLLPTGKALDAVDGVEVTCIDNGMPSVLIRAADLGARGDEPPEELEHGPLADRVRALRAAAMPLMGIDEDPDATTVPKMVLLGPPGEGGSVTTRSFIPERVHQAIGVLGAASVAAAVMIPGTIADGIALLPEEGQPLRIEHPTGFLDLLVTPGDGDHPIASTSVLRTARMLMDGVVYPGPDRHQKSEDS